MDGSHASMERRAALLVDIRPWGEFRQYTLNEPSTVKLISVAAHQCLSLQRHAMRDELWIVLDDGLWIEIGEERVRASAGEEFFVPRQTLHRVIGGTVPGRFVEVCFGEFDEDDIERVEDAYGRR